MDVSSLEKAFTVANTVYISAVVVAAVATIFVFLFASWLTEAKDAELRRFQNESAKSIAEANARAAEANQKAEEERLARVELEAKVAWRRLSKDKQTALAFALRRFSGQRVVLWYIAGDHEGGLFALDIAAALALAKWNVFAPASQLPMAPGGSRDFTIIETGVIVISTGDEASRDASDALVKELLALGFDARKSEKSDERPTPTVVVHIEVRPEGPQGEAKLRKQSKQP